VYGYLHQAENKLNKLINNIQNTIKKNVDINVDYREWKDKFDWLNKRRDEHRTNVKIIN